ncbi:MAG: hydroxymethylglutaryl-CoA lyase [Acidobacteriaceae bacterium]
MTHRIKLIECPRDAWQALPKVIPAEVKADYLRALIAAGFRHIDAVSFVSKAAVPQMADSEQVLACLDAPEDVEIIGIVVNKKSAERAVATGAVTTLGFPYSVSPEFLRRNQRQSPEESLDALEAIGEAAYKAGLRVVVYISMAFGNPYGDAWSAEEVISACDLIADMGIEQISLADTVGVASPEPIAALVAAVRPALPEPVELGVHLHARADDAAAKVAAAYGAGIRRFDMAIGGLGGCPFAQDALVGNLPTEIAIAELKRLGAELPSLSPLDGFIQATRGIEEKFGDSPSRHTRFASS